MESRQDEGWRMFLRAALASEECEGKTGGIISLNSALFLDRDFSNKSPGDSA